MLVLTATFVWTFVDVAYSWRESKDGVRYTMASIDSLDTSSLSREDLPLVARWRRNSLVEVSHRSFISSCYSSILLLAVFERLMLTQVKRLVREEWISQDQERDLRRCFREFGFPSHRTKGPVITVMFLSLLLLSRPLNPLTIFSLYPARTFYFPGHLYDFPFSM